MAFGYLPYSHLVAQLYVSMPPLHISSGLCRQIKAKEATLFGCAMGTSTLEQLEWSFLTHSCVRLSHLPLLARPQ